MFTLFVYCNFLVLLSTTVCSQNINKQNVNIADDYSFLSRYHYTKSKNYLKRRYRIRHWMSIFFGTPCIFTRKLYPVKSSKIIHDVFYFSFQNQISKIFVLSILCNFKIIYWKKFNFVNEKNLLKIIFILQYVILYFTLLLYLSQKNRNFFSTIKLP